MNILFALVICFVTSAYALDADFFIRQERLKTENRERLKGASSYTKLRKKMSKDKLRAALNYSNTRKKQLVLEKAKNSRFEKRFVQDDRVDSKLLQRAQNYANKKRRNIKSEKWENQNLEFEIEVPTKSKL